MFDMFMCFDINHRFYESMCTIESQFTPNLKAIKIDQSNIIQLIDEIQTSDDYLIERFETHDIYELSFKEEAKGLGKKLSEKLGAKVKDIFFSRTIF